MISFEFGNKCKNDMQAVIVDLKNNEKSQCSGSWGRLKLLLLEYISK